MSYKTILTLTGPDFGDTDLKLAAGLCEETGAHLSVFVVALAAPPPAGSAASLSMGWLEEREEDMRRLEERTKDVTTFVAGCGISADVSSDYVEQGRGDEAIGRRARYADLTVLGPELLAGDLLRGKVVDGVLFSSGRPLLVVPAGVRATLRPKRAMVCWDSRIEASRAVRESLGMLDGAQDVRIALVDPEPGEFDHGDEPGADIAAYLARRGVKVTVDRLPRINRSVADVLRRHALDTSAELVVMGAYGHSRLRERIFGGVTKSMLAEPPTQLLLAR